MIGKMVIEGVERTISEGMNPRVNHTHEQWILLSTKKNIVQTSVFPLCDQLIKLIKWDPMVMDYNIIYDIKENDQ